MAEDATDEHRQLYCEALTPESKLAPASVWSIIMPLYFMHLRDGTDEVLDPDGHDMPADRVADAALRAARDCIAGDVLKGLIDLRYRIEVEDKGGAVVHRLEFGDAVAIVFKESDPVAVAA